MKATLRTALLLLGLFLAAWMPRVLALDTFVTTDERKWLTRSANFYQAISHADFAATFQREHPGVTVMWAGTLGFLTYFPTYAQVAPGQFAWENEDLEEWLSTHSTLTPLQLLAAGRWWIALGIALAIMVGYFPLRRLFGAPAAALATLFVAWDPFFIALSRQLHPDGLVSSLIFLALLLFLSWLYGGQKHHYLVASGIVMGLAWLTKIPAIFLVPIAALLVTGELIHRWRAPKSLSPFAPKSLRSLLWGYIGWGVVAILTFVALWPTMWLNPIGTLLGMVAEMRSYVEGHVNPNYFMGQPTNDPGVFFYPIAALFRMTPASVVGLLGLSVIAWRRTWPLDRFSARHSAMVLITFSLLFMLGMMLGAKKFDRYILPIFLALDTLAALGWVGVIQWVVEQMTQTRTLSWPSLRLRPQLIPWLLTLGVAGLLHGLPGFVHYPYYFTYFNPLTGGGTTAARVLTVGWGEGLDAAADWLNQQPNANHLSVAAWYGDGPLSYFLQSEQPILSLWSPEFWFDADYVVFYINQWQRKIPSSEVIDYFAGQTPAHVVRANGLELVRIYAVNKTSPPEFTNLSVESAVDFDDKIRLSAYTLGQRTLLTEDYFVIRLYLKNLAPLDKDYIAAVCLNTPSGVRLWCNESAPANQPASHWPLHTILTDEREIFIPRYAPSGQYKITLAFYDPATPYILLPVDSDRAPEPADAYVITSIQVQSAQSFDVTANWGNVRLTKLQYKPGLKPGQTLFVEMAAEGQVEGSLKLSARLVDSTGKTMAQIDQTLTADMRFDLDLPTDASLGTYTLSAVVYDPVTLNPIPDQEGNFSTILSSVDVQAE